MGKHTLYRIVVAAMVLMVAVSAWGMTAAQDDQTTQTAFLGIGLNESEEGAVVSEVLADSPAAEAGLKVGDTITAIDDTDVTAETLRDVLAGYAVDDSITLHVQRGDETLELTATLASRPEMPQQGFQFQMPNLPDRPLLGVSLEDGENGVVIREVVADSPAAQAGLQVDDVITRINDTDIATATEAVETVQALKAGDVVTVEVQRGDETVSVDVTLASAPAPQIPFLDELGFAYNAEDQTWTVNNLSEDSALYEAGLRSGDVIQSFDGNAYNPQTLNEYLNGLADDATVTLTIERDGATQDIDVPASAVAEIGFFGFGFGPEGFQMPFGMGQATGGRLGVQFVTLNEQTAQEHSVDQTEGALVTEVVADSPAADAGLQVDDIITAVNDEPVNTEFTLRDRVAAYEPEDTITLDVMRGDETLQIEATLGQPEMGEMIPFGDGDFQFFGPDGQPFQVPQPAPFDGQPQTNM